MSREDLDAVGQLEEPAERVEEPFRALHRADREVRPRGVSDEERVAGEHEPWLVRARRVDHGEATVLGTVARGVETAELDRPDGHLVSVVERVVRVGDLCGGMDAHRDPVVEREAAVTGDVVRVRVRLEHPHDPDPQPVGLGEDGLDRERRVDHDSLLCLLASHEVRGAPEIVVQDL